MKRLIVAGGLVLLACVFLHSQTRITSAEYWFDTDPESSIPVSIVPSSEIDWAEDIDIGALKYGLHTFHFRVLDDSSRWSPVATSFFVKQRDVAYGVPRELKKCAYWLDGDIAGATELPIANLPSFTLNKDVDISFLKRGLHVFNFRIQDSGNRWSPASSSFFVYRNEESGSINSAITGMEYWVDGKIGEKSVLQMATSTDVHYVSDLDVSALKKGLHTFSYRFKNADGAFSSVNTQFFIIRSEETSYSGKRISTMEYWVDGNIAEAISISIIPEGDVGIIDDIDFSTLKKGLHKFSYRFKDEAGGVSPAHTCNFLVRAKNDDAAAMGISAYRYWVGDGEVRTVKVDVGEEEVLMLADLDLRLVPKGDVVVNVQVCDDQGRWSGAVYETVMKNSFPYAVLEADKEAMCAGDSLQLTALTVDADTLEWVLGEDLTLAEDTIVISWAEAGSYDVSLNVRDTTEKITNAYDLGTSISVYSLPAIDLGEDVDLCFGENVTLDGPAGLVSYSWSNGSGDASIVVEDAGRYYLIVSDENACVANDSVDVYVHALPVVDLGDSIAIYDTTSMVLDAGEGFEIYVWNGEDGSNLYDVYGEDLGLGSHLINVLVENEFGCVGTDTVKMVVQSSVGLGEEKSIMLKMYPNPARDYVRLEWDDELSDAVKVQIVDLRGRIVKIEDRVVSGAAIDVSDLERGSYYLRMSVGTEVYTMPMVKDR